MVTRQSFLQVLFSIPVFQNLEGNPEKKENLAKLRRRKEILRKRNPLGGNPVRKKFGLGERRHLLQKKGNLLEQNPEENKLGGRKHFRIETLRKETMKEGNSVKVNPEEE
jgi:hypothetical protein